MFSEFAVVPVMEHYGCEIGSFGLGRGLVGEASDFISGMAYELDASVWGALLGACKIHGAVTLGNEVGIRVLELQHLHCGQYMVISQINGEMGSCCRFNPGNGEVWNQKGSCVQFNQFFVMWVCSCSVTYSVRWFID